MGTARYIIVAASAEEVLVAPGFPAPPGQVSPACPDRSGRYASPKKMTQCCKRRSSENYQAGLLYASPKKMTQCCKCRRAGVG